ncbi:hypothetical protein PRIPAC_83690, partial [Pristionchus pacificus]
HFQFRSLLFPMSEVDILTDDEAGIWKPGAWGDNEDGGETSAPAIAPFPRYVPMYDDSIEQHIIIDIKSSDYEKFFSYESKMLAGLISVGTIKFDIELERVKTDHEDHKDLIVHVVCHREGLDPIWRCSFQCEINVSFGDIKATVAGQKKDANNKDNSLPMPVTRLPSEPVNTASIDVNIKMTKWKGINPRMLVDFTKPHEYSNATLIVEGSPLYVNREILAIHSQYFYAMFFNKGFVDSAKTEFNFPDVSYEDMVLFLKLCYPETMVGKRESHITSVDVLEQALHLSEQFVAGSIKNIAETMLNGAPSRQRFHRTSWTRILYIADRFRLSDACTSMIKRLNSESDFITLRQSEEFELLSPRLRSSLLNAALDKLPSSTLTRKKRMPSRTGRIGTFSDVEVDDDDDDSDDVAVIGTVNPSSSAATAPGLTTITSASFGHGFGPDPRAYWPRSQGSGSASTQAAASTSASAAAGTSSTAAATTGSTLAAATSSATFAPTSTAAIPAPPARLSLASPNSNRASAKHVNFGSSLFGNASSSDQRSRQTSPFLFRAYGFVNRKSDKDIKEEVVSEDEMGGDDDEPGPSNRASKRTIKSASGVTTRSRSKRPKKSL